MAQLGWLVKLLVVEGLSLAKEFFLAKRETEDEKLDAVAAGIAMSSGATSSREGKIAQRIGVVYMTQVDKERELRQRIVDLAIGELGESNPAKYWEDVLPAGDNRPAPPSWCGAGYLWCLRQAGATVAKWKRGTGIEGAFRAYGVPVEYTRDPQPGDMAYFTKNQHHAVVVKQLGGFVELVNFNGQSGRVTRSSEMMRNVQVFYSIASLVRRATVDQDRDTDPDLVA